MASKKTKQIAIYGKGGIGKSTTTSNISAALVEAGYRVMQIGCDPKSDSTNTLRNGEYIPSVLDLCVPTHRLTHEAIFKGFGGVYCVEAGAPTRCWLCRSRNHYAVELLKQQNVFEELDLDFVIFVLGDVVCGGLLYLSVKDLQNMCLQYHHPISWPFMLLIIFSKAYRNIPLVAERYLVVSLPIRSIPPSIVKLLMILSLHQNSGSRVRSRSLTVTQSELQGKTTIEANRNLTSQYLSPSARKIAEHTQSKVPSPLSSEELRSWSASWADQLIEVEKARQISEVYA